MNKTATTTLAVLVLSVFALAAGCSAAASPAKSARASDSPVTLASPDAATLALNLQMLREMAAQAAATKQFTHFTKQQSSDAKLISAFKDACTDLQSHKPADVMAMLKETGWTGPEAVAIIHTAANPDTFCPHDYQVVEAWLRASSGG